MTTTIPQGFQVLRSRLEITGLQSSTVATRQRSVRNAVAREFTVLESFLTGFYARSTMIAPLKAADIDIFIVLDATYFKEHRPGSVLNRVRAVLRQTYPTTPRVARNGQAVTITFTDFKVDVVPAFYRQGGGYAGGHDANVVVWIAREFREEHRQALDWLNQRTGDETAFFAVRVEVWRIDDSRPAPHFTLVAAPNEWRRRKRH